MNQPNFLDLVRVMNESEDTFTGWCLEGGRGRIFGGQVAAQSLYAAGSLLRAHRPAHSLHLYFLRPGDPNLPVSYAATRLRDGRTFSTFQVHARQGERVILAALASFCSREDSAEYQGTMPAVAEPDACPIDEFAPPGTNSAVRKPMELRVARRDVAPTAPPRQHIWFRSCAPLPDDGLLHACAVTYMTDLMLPLTAHLPLHDLEDYHAGASLDHSLWFHRPFRADQWLLLDVSASSYSAARGISLGRLFDRAGGLVASAAQESLIRMPAE